MGTKLYVGNLSFNTTETDLQDLFAQAGPVQEVTLMQDKFTGKSRGFAFVTMTSEADAQKAITEFNGKTVEGRPLTVNEAALVRLARQVVADVAAVEAATAAVAVATAAVVAVATAVAAGVAVDVVTAASGAADSARTPSNLGLGVQTPGISFPAPRVILQGTAPIYYRSLRPCYASREVRL